MEMVIRGWIGEARVEDQRRIGELTAQVQRTNARARQQEQLCRSQQRTSWTHGWASHQSSVERRRNGKSGTSSSEHTSYAAEDRYPELVTAIEDPAQGPMDTTRWDAEQIQVSRYLFLILVMLTEEAALRIVQAVHDSNGAEALRLLHRWCNPVDAGENVSIAKRSIAD